MKQFNLFILGIAGGSGAGKSTLAYGIEDKFPGKVVVINLDDYFLPMDKIPKIKNMMAWDDPAALDIDRLVKDLTNLKAGKPVTINTKSTRLNPEFTSTRQKKAIVYEPKPIIVVDGWLLLWFEDIRELLDFSIYLDAPFDLHMSRRDPSNKQEPFDPVYDEMILKPMHEQYVDKSKHYADITLDVRELTADAVLAEAVKHLPASYAKLNSSFAVLT
jgi:uridine kinase